MTETLKGKTIQFTAVRIAKGNPVEGLVLSEDEESICVQLSHTIEGLVTIWYDGTERTFDKNLIHSIKIIK